jgi:hypothetical protein
MDILEIIMLVIMNLFTDNDEEENLNTKQHEAE